MSQKPLGPKDEFCPLWRKSMAKVCHTCPWWTLVRGADPQTGVEIDQWSCAIAWGPTLAINTAKEARQGAAATESLRNAVARGTHAEISLQETLAALLPHPPESAEKRWLKEVDQQTTLMLTHGQ